MKRKLLTMLLAMGIGAMAAPGEVEGDIPFAFHVGNLKFEPGHYMVRLNPSNTMLMIRNSADRSERMFLTRSGVQGKNQPNSFVFQRINGDYFLERVWIGQEFGTELMPGKTQREMLAKQITPETTTVAARGRLSE